MELEHATRMKDWLIEQCDRIHNQWGVSVVSENSLIEALDAMTGERIPDWLPTRIRFEAEDGNMVIKLDYEKQDGSHQEKINFGAGAFMSSPPSSRSIRDSPIVYELPNRTGDSSNTPESTAASTNTTETSLGSDPIVPLTDVDFVFKSGRNLCQISGWWPTSQDSGAITFDSQQ
jgi:hypothetical protein